MQRQKYHRSNLRTGDDQSQLGALVEYYTSKGDRVIARSWPKNNSITLSGTRPSERAPLLLPSKAVTEYKECPERTHFTLGQAGWQEVAEDALT